MYEYELRRGGDVIATGRIQLDEAPAKGETLRLGSAHAQVVEVLHLGAEPRLILAA